jgi:O-antigen ligase
MPSTILFVIATLLLSLNFIRPFGLAISDWLYFGALGCAFLETFGFEHHNESCWFRNQFIFAVCLIIIGALISLINSEYLNIAIIEIFQQVFVVTLFVSLVWILVRRGKIKKIIFAFIFSGVFTAGVVLIDYISGSRIGPTLSGTQDFQLWGRFAGTLGHPNKLGYFLVLTVLLSIGQFLNIKISKRAFISKSIWFGLILVQVFGIYMSGSMNSYLGLLLGILILVFASKNNLTRLANTYWIIIAVAFFSIFLILGIYLIVINGLPNLGNNIMSQAAVRVLGSTSESRWDTYIQAWDQIIKNPFIGVGYDQISTSGIGSQSRFLDFSVHNSLLEIFYTGGFFAFIGWITIYIWVGSMAISALIKGVRKPNSQLIVGLAAANLVILFMDQFQDGIYQREKWLMIGLLAGVSWEMRRIETLFLEYKTSDQKSKSVGL